MHAPMAITMGDASGVGPEIVLRLAAAGHLSDGRVVVVGDAAVLYHGAELLGRDVLGAPVPIEVVAGPEQPLPDRIPVGVLPVVDVGLLGASDHRPGTLDAATGAAARAYVARATDDALAGRVAGVVTLPVNKEAVQRTDPTFVGHTEFIAARCGSDRITMMLTTDQVAVTHVSTHVSLREAIERVRRDRVLDVVEMTHDALSRFLERPRLAVCGLNPHAGEHGLFGDEDAREIAPAVEAARARGLDVSGPLPADTVFHLAVHRDRYDGIVCMYHDQGHAPMKLLAFETGVNVTLGLPIVRTSVDHGTAFDIAWQGIADVSSFVQAIKLAVKLC